MEKFIGILIGLLLIYLAFASCEWDFNPGHWGSFARFFCIIFMLAGLKVMSDD